MSLYGRTMVARVRYRFDNALSRGPVVIILWLAAIALTLSLVAAVFVSVLGLRYNGDQRAGVLEGFWQSLLRSIDTGTLAGDNGWPLRIISLLVTLSGIFVASALIGLIASGINQRIDDLGKGRSSVLEQSHVLVLGWSPRLFKVLSELIVANGDRKGSAVVILATEDKAAMEDAIRARVGRTGATRVVCRTGDPAAPDDLAMVNLALASAVVVLGRDDREGDADVVRTVMAVMTDDPHFERAHVVAELANRHYADSLRHTTDGRVLTVQADAVIAEITAQACHEVGLSRVYRELLDFEDEEITIVHVPELDGRPFGEGLLAFDGASLIGVRHTDGTVDLTPSMDALFAATDEAIVITQHDQVDFSGFTEVTPPPAPHHAAARRGPDRILVVGWSDLGELILDDLDPLLGEHSTVDVVYDRSLFDHDPLADVKITHGTIEAHESKCEAAYVAGLGPARVYDHVVVLGYRDTLSHAEADARTLLTLLSVRRTWPPVGDTRPRVVAEVLDARNVDIAQATGIDDFVVSDELASLMIAQLAHRPELGAVFDQLFASTGASIAAHPARWYVPAADLAWAEVVAAVRTQDLVAIGYRHDDGRLRLNPHKAERVHLDHHDRIILVGQVD